MTDKPITPLDVYGLMDLIKKTLNLATSETDFKLLEGEERKYLEFCVNLVDVYEKMMAATLELHSGSKEIKKKLMDLDKDFKNNYNKDYFGRRLELLLEDKDKDKDDDDYNKVWEEVDGILDREFANSKIGRERKIDYSAYGERKGKYTNNLNRIAAKGKVVLIAEYDGWGVKKDFRSEVLENPTWLQVYLESEKMIRVRKDGHHVFLEGISKVRKEGDITVYEFNMGS